MNPLTPLRPTSPATPFQAPVPRIDTPLAAVALPSALPVPRPLGSIVDTYA